MTEWGLRTRAAASDYFTVFVAVAVVAAALGGWLVYTTHVEPGTETEPEVQGSWQSVADYGHAATVTENNRVFPTGTTLEDRSTYYTRLSPVLNGTFDYRFEGNDGELDVEAETTLVVRSVGDGKDDGGDAGEDEEVLWSVEEPLDDGSTTLEPGEELAVPFSVNVSAVLEDIEAIEDDLGASPGETEVLVRTDVAADGTAAGGPAEHEAQYVLTLEPGSDTYGVSGSEETERHDRVEPVTRVVDHGTVRASVGPLLLFVGLGGAAVLAIGRREGLFDVTERERAAVAFAEEREEFDDWISRGTVPETLSDGSTVEIESLEDLVDVAVDADARVVENVEDGVFYVLDDDNCYAYAPPSHLRRF